MNPADIPDMNTWSMILSSAQGELTQMNSVVSAPIDWVESVGRLRLPAKADRRLQALMDRNNEGTLSALELAEMESLVELSETMSLVRAEALHLLGRRPE